MKLIPKILFDDIFVTKIQQLNWSSTLEDLLEKVNALPTIDPISIIDEMIRIRRNHRDTTEDVEFAKVSDSWIAVLEELKDILYIKSWEFQKDLDKITF